MIDAESCICFERGKCKACQKLCPTNAIDFEQQDEVIEIKVGNIITATGWKMFDCHRLPQYGYGRLANVFTSHGVRAALQRGRSDQRQDPHRDGKTEPESVAIIHCVGSRDRGTTSTAPASAAWRP